MSDPPVARHELPDPPSPRGAYVPWVRHAGLVVTAGMTPRRDGELTVRGVVGVSVDPAAARAAAGVAAENALAAVAAGAGGLQHVERCLRMTVYIACADGFADLSEVADGASAAIEAHLGAHGLPARSAIGVRALPGGSPVEVELTAAVRA